MSLGELLRFGRSIRHNLPFLTTLQHVLTAAVSEVVQEDVVPAYNFFCLYNNLGVCEVHMDAPSAKWTPDLCIEHTAPWPLNISPVSPWPVDLNLSRDEDWQTAIKDQNEFEPHCMNEGDAVVFAGSSQWHFRPRIPRVRHQNFCHLAFLHFLPRGSGALVTPQLWPDLLDLPEIRDVCDATHAPTDGFLFQQPLD